MKTIACFGACIRFTAGLTVLLAAANFVFAQSTLGTIQGRVAHALNGEYLANARVTVEGTSLETFTDADGTYRLTNVPAGAARVTAFYTGLVPQTRTVNVSAGQIATHDVSLNVTETKTDGTVVKLDEFRVETSREMDAAALAINEQRFASNIKTVLSTEEFGNVAEGNVAEFLKFMPGVTIDYTGGNARDINLAGVPSDYVPVMVDGFSVAAASNGATNRAVQSDMININNLSRIEVSFSPTPESQGSALAGSVNMVPRSSFERVRPVLNMSAYVLMRDNARDFNKVPGPKPSPTRNVHPGFDFSYVAPVNKRFGFTLSGGISTNYSPQDNIQMTWRGAGAVTNANFPATTPDKPYLSQFLIQDAPKVTTRRSMGATVDYKLTQYDRLTFGFQYSSFDGRFIVSNVTFNVGRVNPGDFTAFSTRGAAGQGTLQSNHQERNRFNRTYMPTFIWRHDGPGWKADLGLGFSQQSDDNKDMEQGFFRIVNMQRSGVTISFDDIFYLRPRSITVTDTAGAPVNPFALSSYALVSGNRQANDTYDLQRTAYGSVRRDFHLRVPFTLKAGFDLRQAIRDFRGGTITYNYHGRDGRTSTTPIGNDDSPVPFYDQIISQRVLPYGFPKLEAPSNRKVYEHFRANTNQFAVNDNTTYRNQVTDSKYSEELISSLYLRGDVSLLNNRLKLVGGLRAEQTNVEAQGPLTDPTLNFQRNASGQIVRNPNGTPVLLVPTSNALGVSQLTYLDRAARTEKEYLRLFPSINASYSIRENLIGRAAYFRSVGRPNFIQYSGGIMLPDTDVLPGNTAASRITVNNAAIKAWQGDTFSVRLERYFEGVGQLSVGAFRREIENFFGATVFNATPEFLALYNLDPALYDAYDVATQHNVPGTVRMHGVDVSYKQALTFLPSWGRGVQVFANASSQRLLGDETASLAGFIPKSASWGVSLTRPKWNARVNWNYRGRQRNAPVTGVGIEPGTFNYSSKRLYVDVLGEYYFWKRVGFFVNLRNVGDATEDTEIVGPNTPEHAQFRQRIDYASLWTIGLKGTW